MINWEKPIQYKLEGQWQPATLVFTCRHDSSLKLVVIHVGNSDFDRWVTERDSDVRNVPKKHVKYLHLYSSGEWIICSEDDSLPSYETIRLFGNHRR